MNHFMARLIFCFFAEDTDIFRSTGLFTATIEQMSARDSSNTDEVISELFRAMNTKLAERAAAGEERSMPVDHFFGVDSLVAHRGVDVAVPGDELRERRGAFRLAAKRVGNQLAEVFAGEGGDFGRHESGRSGGCH